MYSNSNWSSCGKPDLHQKEGAQVASTGHWKGQYPWPFGRDPNSSVTNVTRSDRLKGNVSVTCVTLVPWRRERRRRVPSRRHRLGSSVKTWICAAPAAYLYSRCVQRQLDAIMACQQWRAQGGARAPAPLRSDAKVPLRSGLCDMNGRYRGR